MATSTPDLYALLYVSPDAPTAVIRAAFRALVTLQNDGAGAVDQALLYQAFGVLSDPGRRRQYDVERAQGLAEASTSGQADPPGDDRGSGPSTALAPLAVSAYQSSAGLPVVASTTAAAATKRHPILRAVPVPPAPCRMCGTTFTPTMAPNARCAKCKAPITPPRRPEGTGHGDGRRAMGRVAKSDLALLLLPGRTERVDVRLRDLSLEGMGLSCAIALPPGTIARVMWRGVDAVISILACRPNGTIYDLSARILASAVEAQGGFVQVVR